MQWRNPGGCGRRELRRGRHPSPGPRPPGRVSAVGPWALGRVFARRGHRRCLYPRCWRLRARSAGRLTGAAGTRGRRAVCSPGGAIDVVYTPAAREHAGRGNGAVLGAGSRVGVVGRVLSFLRGVRGVLLGPVGGSATVVGVRVVCLPGGAIDVVYTPAAREHDRPARRARRDCWGCGPGPSSFFPCSARRAGRVGGCGLWG